jgi:uncharacterized phage infection (PIP) family protein YhgE
MPYQNIDAVLAGDDVQAIKDSFDDILDRMPFAVNLTEQERKSLFKAGPDSVSFVQNALAAAQANPTVFPGTFNVTAFQKDVNLFTTLTELRTLAASLTDRIDDTRMAVGSEAMQEASQAYNYLKAAVGTVPGLKPTVDQLGARFQKAGGQRTPVPVPA